MIYIYICFQVPVMLLDWPGSETDLGRCPELQELGCFWYGEDT